MALMVHDSDPNAAKKHALYTLEWGGGRKVINDPTCKSRGSIDPP